MSLNHIENLETWLDPFSEEEIVDFLVKKLKMIRNDNLSVGGLYHEKVDGKDHPYISFSGFKNYDVQVRQKLGAFGPYLADEHNTYYYQRTFNTILLGYSDEESKMYYEWIKLVAKKNQGRKINGLTYMEDLSNRLSAFVEHEKDYHLKMIQKIENGNQEMINALGINNSTDDDDQPNQ